MAVQAELGGEKEQEIAWKDAEASGGGKRQIPVTGEALATEDQELQRNMALIRPQSTSQEVDERKSFRAPRQAVPDVDPPGTTLQAINPDRPLQSEDMKNLYDPPHERAQARAQQRQPVEETPPPAPPEPPAPAPAPIQEDDEGIALEQRILGVAPQTELDEIPDETVKIGGKDIPLSRIREGLKASKERADWEASLTRRSQSMNTAWEQVGRDLAKGLTNDPVAALRKLGMRDEEIMDRMRQGGLSVGAPAAAVPTVATLPEDADPLTKSLFAQNQELQRAVSQTSRSLQEVRESMDSERRQRSAEATEAQRLATLSGVKSELLASASKMPSMKDGQGKLSQLGNVLVGSTMLLLERELQAGRVPEHSVVRQRAFELFGAQARENGVTPKVEQARRAIEGKKPPIPTRPGNTVQHVHPGAAALKPPTAESFDWSNDDDRRKHMRAYAQKLEAQMAGE